MKFKPKYKIGDRIVVDVVKHSHVDTNAPCSFLEYRGPVANDDAPYNREDNLNVLHITNKYGLLSGMAVLQCVEEETILDYSRWEVVEDV